MTRIVHWLLDMLGSERRRLARIEVAYGIRRDGR